METSAKTATNVNELFVAIGVLLPSAACAAASRRMPLRAAFRHRLPSPSVVAACFRRLPLPPAAAALAVVWCLYLTACRHEIFLAARSVHRSRARSSITQRANCRRTRRSPGLVVRGSSSHKTRAKLRRNPAAADHVAWTGELSQSLSRCLRECACWGLACAQRAVARTLMAPRTRRLHRLWLGTGVAVLVVARRSPRHCEIEIR